jgi:hypothetical protein
MGDHPAVKFKNSFDQDRAFFDSQINHLKEIFGHQRFSDERCNIIFNEMKKLDRQVIEQVFKDLISNAKQSPVLKDFQESISRQRESGWNKEKKQHTSNLKSFFSEERVAKLLGTLRENLSLPSEERRAKTDAFIDGFESTRSKNPSMFSGCPECADSGVVYLKEESPVFGGQFFNTVYACNCSFGNQHPNYSRLKQAVRK